MCDGCGKCSCNVELQTEVEQDANWLVELTQKQMDFLHLLNGFAYVPPESEFHEDWVWLSGQLEDAATAENNEAYDKFEFDQELIQLNLKENI